MRCLYIVVGLVDVQQRHDVRVAQVREQEDLAADVGHAVRLDQVALGVDLEREVLPGLLVADVVDLRVGAFAETLDLLVAREAVQEVGVFFEDAGRVFFGGRREADEAVVLGEEGLGVLRGFALELEALAATVDAAGGARVLGLEDEEVALVRLVRRAYRLAEGLVVDGPDSLVLEDAGLAGDVVDAEVRLFRGCQGTRPLDRGLAGHVPAQPDGFAGVQPAGKAEATLRWSAASSSLRKRSFW